MEDVITQSARHVTTNRESFEALYERAFPRAAKFISKMNGSFTDAKDLFQDALVIYYEKRMDENFEITTTEEAYVLGIVKHLWVRKFKHDIKNISLEDVDGNITFSELEDKPNENKLLQLLERTGKKCLELLTAFYYEEKSLREIGKTFSYQSEHSTAVQKYKCLEKMRDTIKEKAMNYEDFLE
jgi:RNA polymerase sigma factor (sigma-70 family)